MAKTVTASETCPMELGINILSGKWKLMILWRIYKSSAIRFNELQRQVGKITTKTLTEQLKELEELQIVKRTVYPETPPRVEYALTETGETLAPILQALCDWGKSYRQYMNLHS